MTVIPLFTTQTPGDCAVVRDRWVNWRHPLGWELPLLAEARAQALAREITAVRISPCSQP